MTTPVATAPVSSDQSTIDQVADRAKKLRELEQSALEVVEPIETMYDRLNFRRRQYDSEKAPFGEVVETYKAALSLDQGSAKTTAKNMLSCVLQQHGNDHKVLMGAVRHIVDSISEDTWQKMDGLFGRAKEYFKKAIAFFGTEEARYRKITEDLDAYFSKVVDFHGEVSILQYRIAYASSLPLGDPEFSSILAQELNTVQGIKERSKPLLSQCGGTLDKIKRDDRVATTEEFSIERQQKDLAQEVITFAKSKFPHIAKLIPGDADKKIREFIVHPQLGWVGECVEE